MANQQLTCEQKLEDDVYDSDIFSFHYGKFGDQEVMVKSVNDDDQELLQKEKKGYDWLMKQRRPTFSGAFTPKQKNEVFYPYWVETYGYVQQNDKTCFIGKRYRGDLFNYRIKNVLSSMESLSIIYQIASGLKRLHEQKITPGGIFSQDIYYENVDVLNDDGDAFIAVDIFCLGDFGRMEGGAIQDRQIYNDVSSLWRMLTTTVTVGAETGESQHDIEQITESYQNAQTHQMSVNECLVEMGRLMKFYYQEYYFRIMYVILQHEKSSTIERNRLGEIGIFMKDLWEEQKGFHELSDGKKLEKIPYKKNFFSHIQRIEKNSFIRVSYQGYYETMFTKINAAKFVLWYSNQKQNQEQKMCLLNGFVYFYRLVQEDSSQIPEHIAQYAARYKDFHEHSTQFTQGMFRQNSIGDYTEAVAFHIGADYTFTHQHTASAIGRFHIIQLPNTQSDYGLARKQLSFIQITELQQVNDYGYREGKYDGKDVAIWEYNAINEVDVLEVVEMGKKIREILSGLQMRNDSTFLYKQKYESFFPFLMESYGYAYTQDLGLFGVSKRYDGSLKQYIQNNKNISEQEALMIILQIACGSQFLQENKYTHKKIESENIFYEEITYEGEKRKIFCLSVFGIFQLDQKQKDSYITQDLGQILVETRPGCDHVQKIIKRESMAEAIGTIKEILIKKHIKYYLDHMYWLLQYQADQLGRRCIEPKNRGEAECIQINKQRQIALQKELQVIRQMLVARRIKRLIWAVVVLSFFIGGIGMIIYYKLKK